MQRPRVVAFDALASVSSGGAAQHDAAALKSPKTAEAFDEGVSAIDRGLLRLECADAQFRKNPEDSAADAKKLTLAKGPLETYEAVVVPSGRAFGDAWKDWEPASGKFGKHTPGQDPPAGAASLSDSAARTQSSAMSTWCSKWICANAIHWDAVIGPSAKCGTRSVAASISAARAAIAPQRDAISARRAATSAGFGDSAARICAGASATPRGIEPARRIRAACGDRSPSGTHAASFARMRSTAPRIDLVVVTRWSKCITADHAETLGMRARSTARPRRSRSAPAAQRVRRRSMRVAVSIEDVIPARIRAVCRVREELPGERCSHSRDSAPRGASLPPSDAGDAAFGFRRAARRLAMTASPAAPSPNSASVPGSGLWIAAPKVKRSAA